MSGSIVINTRVLKHKGELFLAVSTLESMAMRMRREPGWDAELATVQQLIDGAREAERRLF
jgi:hypothetical protein